MLLTSESGRRVYRAIMAERKDWNGPIRKTITRLDLEEWAEAHPSYLTAVTEAQRAIDRYEAERTAAA